MSDWASSRCAACKYLRRRCPQDCIFSPYFPANDPERFASVHRMYGASNVSKLLQSIPEGVRSRAADTLYYDAISRIQDPIYGSVGIISRLQQTINDVENELARTQAELTMYANGITNGASSIQQPAVINEQSIENIPNETVGDENSIPGTFVQGPRYE